MVAIAFRAVFPAGFMPADWAKVGVPIMVCHQGLPAIFAHAAHHHHHHLDQSASTRSDSAVDSASWCPLGGVLLDAIEVVVYELPIVPPDNALVVVPLRLSILPSGYIAYRVRAPPLMSHC